MPDYQRPKNDVIPNVPIGTGAERIEYLSDEDDYSLEGGKYIRMDTDENGVLDQTTGRPTVVCRFSPTPAQRAAIAVGDDLFLAVEVGSRPMLPLQLQVGPGEYLLESAILDREGRAQRADAERPRLFRPGEK